MEKGVNRYGGVSTVGRWLMVLSFAAGLNACTQQTKPEQILPMDFIAGEFTYMADAAVFRDCATGLSYPVAMQGEYLRAEQQYTAMDPGVGEAIYVQLRGHIDSLPSAEESQGKIPTLVIDSLLGFDRAKACDPQALLPGVYESGDDSRGHSVLHLRGDYTFSLMEFGFDGGEMHAEGRWGLVSEMEVALLPYAPAARSSGRKGEGNDMQSQASELSGQQFFQIVPDQEALVRNGGGDQPQVFKKTYL